MWPKTFYIESLDSISDLLMKLLDSLNTLIKMEQGFEKSAPSSFIHESEDTFEQTEYIAALVRNHWYWMKHEFTNRSSSTISLAVFPKSSLPFRCSRLRIWSRWARAPDSVKSCSRIDCAAFTVLQIFLKISKTWLRPGTGTKWIQERIVSFIDSMSIEQCRWGETRMWIYVGLGSEIIRWEETEGWATVNLRC